MYYDRIAHFADIDTRRAMGYPPRKLDLTPWKDFKPRGFETELFLYYPDEMKLVYYETGKYNYFYYEIITNLRASYHPREWIVQEGSRTRGIVHCDETSQNYDVKTKGFHFHTAGMPVFVIKTPTPE